jgi:predicted RNase H-like HicB family nuclease
MRYLIAIEKSATGFGAYVPDLPGVGVVGDSVEEVKRLAAEAIDLHLAGLREDGAPIPAPATTSDYVEIEPGQAA